MYLIDRQIQQTIMNLLSSCFLRRPQKLKKSSLLIWHLLHNVKLKLKISSNFVAFLENTNFTKVKSRQIWQCAPKAWAFFRLVQTSPFFTWKTEMTSECQAGSSSFKVQSNKSAVHLVTIFTSYLLHGEQLLKICSFIISFLSVWAQSIHFSVLF